MSAKVCLPAFNGAPAITKDAITLGQLELLIQALYGLGYDIDTPVTYLFDDDHVWLETVEWDEPALKKAYEKALIPKVVEVLGPEEHGARWIDEDRDTWRWNIDHWEWSRGGESYFKGTWRDGEPQGIFIEVLG